MRIQTHTPESNSNTAWRTIDGTPASDRASAIATGTVSATDEIQAAIEETHQTTAAIALEAHDESAEAGATAIAHAHLFGGRNEAKPDWTEIEMSMATAAIGAMTATIAAVDGATATQIVSRQRDLAVRLPLAGATTRPGVL